jgi:ribosomal protein L33
MAWQKNKICLIATDTDPQTGKKVVYRYYTRKSKGKNKGNAATNKLIRKKYFPKLRKHLEFSETKIKWK